MFLVWVLFLPFVSINAQNYSGPTTDIEEILRNTENLSKAYREKEYDVLANSYTKDGKILPPGGDIISGRESIQERWTLPSGVTILEHKITPVEINIINDLAYDLGYYEGKTRTKNGKIISWKGKYVIIWKKVNGSWLIHWDIWNSIEN